MAKVFFKGKFILFFIAISIFSINSKAQKEGKVIPQAEKGTIDLRNWNFDRDGIIKLDGEWQFYWNSFIEDKEADSTANTKADFISVPAIWNDHTTDKQQFSGVGYASYKLHVKLKKREELAIKYLNAGTSCEVYVDDILLYSSGQPGKTKEQTIPSYRPDIITFFPANPEFKLVLQIANFHHKKGGQWEPLILGTKQQINKYLNIRIFFEILFVGFIFIMAIYHLILFSRHTDEKPSLYFGLFSLLISIRLLVTGEYSIYMLGDLNWSLLVHADYLSFYLAIFFFLFYMRKLFIEEITKIPTVIITSVVAIFTLSALILPPLYFSYWLIYFQIFVVFAGMYTFYALYKALKNKRGGSRYFLYGFGVLFICMFHDILKVNEILYSAPLASVGLTLFILFQAYFLSTRIRTAFETNKKLAAELQRQNDEYLFLNNRYKEQNESLIIAKEKAEESDILKSAFLANMSHEIRTPMNGILGFTRLLKKPNLSGEKKDEFIDVIQKSGMRMLNTVNDIIDISKIDSGQMEVILDDVCLYDEIESLYAFFKPEAEGKGLRFTLINYSIENETIIQTDKSKFNSILTNLIKNAIKFTDTGSIEISYALKNEYLHFSVKDTGIGIPQNRKEAIFNRFEQADYKNNKAFEGSGLGLAISKAYAEMLGGKIRVESVEGKGSQFFFIIPFKTGEKQSTKDLNITNGQKYKIQKEKLKTLIVEDDHASAAYLTEVMDTITSEIIIAQSGDKAIEVCKSTPDIDIILMDIKMPGKDGYETTREIREFNNEVLIIAQTAFALLGDRKKAIKAGCDDYIAKPINAEELYQLIGKLLNNRQAMS